MTKIILFASILLGIYLLIILIVYSVQTNLIFHPQKLSPDYKFNDDSEELFLTTSDGIKINGLFFAAPSDKVILYFHGNAGSLDSWQYVQKQFEALPYNFLIIDYRGFGKSSGDISEAGLYVDAQTAYDYLIKRGFTENQIIVYGRSIGTGVATNLASNNDVGALILESPFTSLKTLASETLPYLIPAIYIKYDFDNAHKINNVSAPLLLIHGTVDNTIPYSHGERLYDEFKGQKTMVTVQGGNHNDLEEFPEFHQALLDFLGSTAD